MQIRRHLSDQTGIVRLYGSYQCIVPQSSKAIRVVQKLEYCAGGNLITYVSKRLQAVGPCPEFAAHVIRRLAVILSNLHTMNGAGCVVLADVKMDNLLLRGEVRPAHVGEWAPPAAIAETLAMCDFDTSVWIPSDAHVAGAKSVHRSPLFMGTYGFASPEQTIPDVHGMRSYSAAGDMWSVGVILYSLLANRFPFTRRKGARLERQLQSPLPAHALVAADADAADLVNRLLALDPSARPTAEEVLIHPWITRLTAPTVSDIQEAGEAAAASEVVVSPVALAAPDVDEDQELSSGADLAPSFEEAEEESPVGCSEQVPDSRMAQGMTTLAGLARHDPLASKASRVTHSNTGKKPTPDAVTTMQSAPTGADIANGTSEGFADMGVPHLGMAHACGFCSADSAAAATPASTVHAVTPTGLASCSEGDAHDASEDFDDAMVCLGVTDNQPGFPDHSIDVS